MAGVDRTRLLRITEQRDRNYHRFLLEKRAGGFREILTPKPLLKRIQRLIYVNILATVELDQSCLGFREGRSIKDNAQIHANQDAVMKVDLYRFFDTISEKRVYGMFKSLGYHTNLSVDFAKLTTLHPSEQYYLEIMNDKNLPDHYPDPHFARLPQGAPTSPVISNIIARNLDFRLRKLAEKLGVNYSRYADDITFSGVLTKLPKIHLINDIVRSEGFFINGSKISLRKKGTKQLVTGLTVSNGVHVPKKYKQETWRHLYYSKKYGAKDHLRRIGKTGISGFEEWLLGRIHFIRSIEPEVGDAMLEKYEVIDWSLI
nr:reverse transcriptase family protein [Tumebacillus amylolyticus]